MQNVDSFLLKLFFYFTINFGFIASQVRGGVLVGCGEWDSRHCWPVNISVNICNNAIISHMSWSPCTAQLLVPHCCCRGSWLSWALTVSLCLVMAMFTIICKIWYYLQPPAVSIVGRRSRGQVANTRMTFTVPVTCIHIDLGFTVGKLAGWPNTYHKYTYISTSGWMEYHTNNKITYIHSVVNHAARLMASTLQEFISVAP